MRSGLCFRGIFLKLGENQTLMQVEALLNQIDPTFLRLREIIDASSDYFNRPPSYGGWTPGQAVRHIQMSVSGMPALLSAPSQERREPINQKVPQIIGVFLNFDQKYQAPGMIQPEEKEFDAHRFQDFFLNWEKSFKEAVAQNDLGYLCTGFELPGFGPMTRLEFVAFTLFHTQRHIDQIRRMLVDFNASTF